MKQSLAFFTGILLTAWAPWGLAGNEAPPLELVWSSPSECPTGNVVRDEALRLASADGRPLPRVRATVVIERSGDSDYALTLTTGAAGSGSVQTFRAGTCRAVVQAVTVTLALLLNPAGVSAEAEPAARAPSQPGRSVRARGGAAGLVGVQIGLLPKLGPTFGGELGLEYGRASAWLGGAYGPRQRDMVEGEAEVGGELALARGMLYGCWAATPRSPRVNLCAGMDFNRVSGRGVGVVDEKVGVISWLSVLGGAVADIAVHPQIALRIGAFAGVPLSHPTAFVEGAGEVHQPAAVTAAVHAGIAAFWP